jgi:hypothetical protein
MPDKKNLVYKDEKGNKLYGFSQVNLERTNQRLNSVVIGIKLLIVLFVILLIGMAIFLGWVAKNDIITRLIYGY